MKTTRAPEPRKHTQIQRLVGKEQLRAQTWWTRPPGQRHWLQGQKPARAKPEALLISRVGPGKTPELPSRISPWPLQELRSRPPPEGAPGWTSASGAAATHRAIASASPTQKSRWGTRGHQATAGCLNETKHKRKEASNTDPNPLENPVGMKGRVTKPRKESKYENQPMSHLGQCAPHLEQVFAGWLIQAPGLSPQHRVTGPEVVGRRRASRSTASRDPRNLSEGPPVPRGPERHMPIDAAWEVPLVSLRGALRDAPVGPLSSGMGPRAANRVIC